MTNTQTLTVFGPNIHFEHGATFEVHVAGCGHINRKIHNGGWLVKLREVAEQHTGTYTNRTEVCDECYDPDNFECESGEYLYDFHFAPCVKNFPEK